MYNYNTKHNKFHVPRIGMRIIKSAMGVLICFLIDSFRGDSGIVFYSLLAVLWCIRDYVSETKQFAIQRTVGTVIGAIYGLIFIIGNSYFTLLSDASNNIVSGIFSFITGNIGYSLFVSLSIILVLYTTVVLKQKQASYFSCVVFLSIVINHMGDVNPYFFVWNRFLDTMIGILVGLFINSISVHHRHNKDVLFLSGLDDTLLAPGGKMSEFSKIELNRMIERGVNFTVSTIRTPASLLEPLRGIKLKLPVIAMDGAALFNISENSYEKVYVISPSHSRQIQEYLCMNNLLYFTNVVIEDVLLIYYPDTEDEAYNELVSSMKKSPYRNYLKQQQRIENNVVYFMIFGDDESIRNVYNKMKEEELFDELKVTVSASFEKAGYSLLKIYNKNATKENMLDYLKEKTGISRTVSYGTIEGKYTHIIEPGDFNRVVKLMKREM